MQCVSVEEIAVSLITSKVVRSAGIEGCYILEHSTRISFETVETARAEYPAVTIGTRSATFFAARVRGIT